MTIGGAIAELQNLIDADDVPFYYKVGIKKVIETIQMEVNEQNRLLKEIAHRLDLHERAMAKAMRGTADTPQTESTGSPIGDYRDGVGAWQTDRMTEEEIDTMLAKALVGQTDCDDRYAIRTDSGEVVAHACPLGCERTDCGWK